MRPPFRQITLILLLFLSAGLGQAQKSHKAYDIAVERIQQAVKTDAVELNLCCLDLTELPPEIGQLENLRTLRLNNNPLTELPAEIGQLSHLQTLDLTGTQLASLPESFWRLPELQTLYLRYVPLGAIPAELGQLSTLRQLDLRDMNLVTLPDNFGNLAGLRYLDIGGNFFTHLPPSVLNLVALQELHVHYTPLTTLPADIANLRQLRVLDVRHTALTALPPEIGDLVYLRSLLIENTQISTLPVQLGFLEDLVDVWVFDTPLPYDVTRQQTIPNLDTVKAAMRQTAFAEHQLPHVTARYIGQYPEAPLQVYGQVAPLPTPIPIQDMFFENYGLNPFVATTEDNLSTFAMDVDTGSYTIARSYLLDSQQLPPPDAIRSEEFINYFPTNYAAPQGDDAFAIHMDAAPTPFVEDGNLLLRVGLQGRSIAPQDRDPALLIFVIDISGSMEQTNRLELAKQALTILVGQLREDDRVGIVVYADAARTVLDPTPASQQERIVNAIGSLQTEGSTYAEAGLRLGYEMGLEYQRPGENARVILISDGVANVGATGPEAILETIEQGTKQGLTLSTIGVGMGNFNDVLMEQLADNGNGNYFYVDNLREARRVFVYNLTSTLQVIAYDAKIQVEFNPDAVTSYRLIGYENRAIADEDFRNDTVDAGEVGAGHTITALYEIEPNPQAQAGAILATTFIRYEEAETREVVEVNQPFALADAYSSFEDAPDDFRLLAGIAEFSELLRHDSFAEDGSYEAVVTVLETLVQNHPDVGELVQMVVIADQLSR